MLNYSDRIAALISNLLICYVGGCGITKDFQKP